MYRTKELAFAYLYEFARASVYVGFVGYDPAGKPKVQIEAEFVVVS